MDAVCRQRCQRPGCGKPDDHLLTRYDAAHRCQVHSFDCSSPLAFDRPPPPAFAPPRAGAAPPFPTGPFSPHPAHGPAGFLPQQDAWVDPLTRRAALRYLAVHLERTLSYIAHRVIRNDFRPAPIAITLAAQDLACSRATWVRDVTMLEKLGLIARERRPGRPKGGGKNAGSLYQVHWGRIPMAWPRKFKPAHRGGNGQFETGSLREEIGSLLGQAVFETGSRTGENVALSATENRLKMTRNRPTDGNQDEEVEGRGTSEPPGPLSMDLRPPTPTKTDAPLIPPVGGPSAEQGIGPPAELRAEVRSSTWYRNSRQRGPG